MDSVIIEALVIYTRPNNLQEIFIKYNFLKIEFISSIFERENIFYTFLGIEKVLETEKLPDEDWIFLSSKDANLLRYKNYFQLLVQ